MVKELDAKIKEIIRRNYNVKSFRLEIDNDVSFKPGQFLHLSINVEDRQIWRYLSISNSPTEKGCIEFTKKITESEFSKKLDSLQKADLVKIKYPYGTFTLEGEYKKVAFLSGGIGITPIRSIIKYIVDKAINTDIILLYGNHSIRDILFRDDFDLMQHKSPNLRIVYIISEAQGEWQGRVGRINAQAIIEEIPDYTDRRFYICGPPLMVKSMRAVLEKDLSLSEDKIVTEGFAGY